MKLATRVSTFFLVALAAILLAHSVLFFAVARWYLYRRFDEQLQSSLHTLVAAIEVEDDDVKWEPSDHTVTLGTESGVEDIRWLVHDERGGVVDRSRNLRTTPEEATIMGMLLGTSREAARPSAWRLFDHRLAAPHPKPASDRTPLEHAELTVVVARSLSDLNSTLNWLALATIALPAICWLAATLAGQWYCRQAIAPVRHMAASARSIIADDTLARLDVPASGDELQELGVVFNELLDQVFVGYERQRRFAGDAAHQLRTPLTVLQGQVDVALRKERSAEDYAQTLEVVRSEAVALSRTVEALMFLAKPHDDASPPDCRWIDFGEWLGAYMLKWQADDRWHDMRLECGRDIGCRSSPELLAQLLDILISNSLKYSSAGSPISVYARHHDGNVQLAVADQGIGIAAADWDSIFQPFFRARQARQSGVPGIGLGLAIAKRIAFALGGTLRCSSQTGAGSRFTLEVPIVVTECTSSATAGAAPLGT